MNSLRQLLILQLREWLKVLENDNISDNKAISNAPDLFEIRYENDRRIWQELRKLNQKLDDINENRNRFVCQLKEDENVFHLISNLSSYKEAIKDFGSWLVGADSLIVADPYFFSFSKSEVHRTESDYTEALIKILPNKLEEVEIFHLPGPNKRIFRNLKKHCKNKGIRFKNFSTTEIHDRVWIKNNTDGKVIGTSFGGLGNKIAFILDLPEDDKNKFIRELYRIRSAPLP